MSTPQDQKGVASTFPTGSQGETPGRDGYSEWPIFISYRRSALTGEIAKWLEEELGKELIQGLNEQWFKPVVFVDAMQPVRKDFRAHLEPHLAHSRALIIIADAGAGKRKQDRMDYLYLEFDWWREKRPRNPPIILDTDRKSAVALTAQPELQHWQKHGWLECYWQEWKDRGSLDTEKQRLLKLLRQSIREFGHAVHLAEVRKLRRLVKGLGIAVLAILAAGVVAWLKEKEARQLAADALMRQGISLTSRGREMEALLWMAKAVHSEGSGGTARDHLDGLVLNTPWNLLISSDMKAKADYGYYKHVFSETGGRIAFSDFAGGVEVWEWTNPQKSLARVVHQESNSSVVAGFGFLEDGRKLFTAGNGGVAFWNLEMPAEPARRLAIEANVKFISLSPDETLFLAALSTEEPSTTSICCLSLDGQRRAELASTAADVHEIIFSPDGTRLAAAVGCEAKLWDARTFAPIELPNKITHENTSAEQDGSSEDNSILTLRFTPDGRYLFTGSKDHSCRVWNLNDGSPAGAPMPHPSHVAALEVSADSKRVLTAAGYHGDWQGFLWPLPFKGRVHENTQLTLSHETYDLMDLAGSLPYGTIDLSEDGTWALSSSSADRVGRALSLSSGHFLGTPLYHNSSIRGVAAGPGVDRALTYGADGVARIWNIRRHGALPEISESKDRADAAIHHATVVGKARSPNGRWAVTVLKSGVVEISKGQSGSPALRQVQFAPITNDVRTVVIHNNGRRWPWVEMRRESGFLISTRQERG